MARELIDWLDAFWANHMDIVSGVAIQKSEKHSHGF
jgi:hypothetical protein